VLTVSEAIKRLTSDAKVRVSTENLPVIEALGRVLAEDIDARLNVPPTDNSAMDGYALRFEDIDRSGKTLAISQRIAAGHPPQPLEPGTAARIFTGAEVPAGADTVVMQENCAIAESGVRVTELPEKGANIRPCGQDLQRGQRMFNQGHRLRAQDLGLVASQGLSDVRLYKKLRVAVISTGDELLEPGEANAPGKIFNSNRYTLHGLLQGWGMETIDLGIVRDDPEQISDRLQRAARSADVIVCSGGVSVGEEDHVKAVVESLGSIDLWRIAIRPGKPFAFGQVMDTPFLGLPGNPVSVLVTLLVIGRPYLLASQGIANWQLTPVSMPANFSKKAVGREEYLRVRSSSAGLELYPSQSSGVLMSTCWADGLAIQPIDEEINKGDPLDYLPFPLFLT